MSEPKQNTSSAGEPPTSRPEPTNTGRDEKADEKRERAHGT